MYLKLLIVQFFNDILNQKLRAFLTLFGLTWGTTAIMLMLAIGEANKKMMIRQMNYIGENVVSLSAGLTTIPFRGLGKFRRIKFQLEDVEKLRQLDVIKKAGGQINTGDVNMKYKDKEVAFDLAGIQPEWAELRKVIVDSNSRNINFNDNLQKKHVAVIGNKVKRALFENENPIGKFIKINNSPFLIVGLLKPKKEATFFKDMHEDTVFIPITTFLTMFHYDYIERIVYTPKNIKENKQTLNTVIHFFARLKYFHPDDKSAIRAWNMADASEFINNFTLGLQIFMGIVGVFTIIVAAIGVANIMNVIVEERTKEIGIKMALGIKRKIIMIQFILESFLFTFIGGIIGFLLSKIICNILVAMNIKGMGTPNISLRVAIITTVVLGIASLLSGYFPARTAAKLTPVDALKHQ